MQENYKQCKDVALPNEIPEPKWLFEDGTVLSMPFGERCLKGFAFLIVDLETYQSVVYW